MAEKKQNRNIPPMGVSIQNGRLFAAFTAENENCGVLLYEKQSGSLMQIVSFAKKDVIGKVRYGSIAGGHPEEILYQFYDGDKVYPDPYARIFAGRTYGEPCAEASLLSAVISGTYDWEDDALPQLTYEDSVVYCMHVRGFTMQEASGVRNRGTFSGLQEKLPYLKELGITTLELQPAYEFVEKEEEDEKLNYWGYKKGFYYAPKAAYAAGQDPVREFKDLVKAIHKMGMELVMQFYFPEEIPRLEIPDILRFWASEYHVDGFRLMGTDLPVKLISEDPYLASVKLWAEQMPGQQTSINHNMALYDGQYRTDMRRFLRGEQDMLTTVCRQMRYKPAECGVIHFFSNYDGFTMMDLVSYNDKHNEENGEFNADGCDYNMSWNCGIEGMTRKSRVLKLRMQQYQNAMSMLFLSQGTPLLFMGDEFGNTQYGNNNPYCQDNEIAWLDWTLLEKQEECYRFTKQMIQLRKAHPILRLRKEPRVMDYLAIGYPDLSYHGAEAWRADYRSLDRQLGMMYCGKYARVNRTLEDDFLYLAINMHWEEKQLALPRLPEEMRWELLFTTDQTANMADGQEAEQLIQAPPRTVSVYISRKRNEHGERMEAF